MKAMEKDWYKTIWGMDITPAYVEYAKEQACREQLNMSRLFVLDI